jgi:ribose transport system substrate-binding protein
VARADGGFNTDQANAVMTNILPAQPNIDTVYGANDAETYGAITAIKAADRFQPAGKPSHIYAIGIDGSAPGINGIRDGSQDASVSQQFIKMSTLLIDNIHGKETGAWSGRSRSSMRTTSTRTMSSNTASGRTM